MLLTASFSQDWLLIAPNCFYRSQEFDPDLTWALDSDLSANPLQWQNTSPPDYTPTLSHPEQFQSPTAMNAMNALWAVGTAPGPSGLQTPQAQSHAQPSVSGPTGFASQEFDIPNPSQEPTMQNNAGYSFEAGFSDASAGIQDYIIHPAGFATAQERLAQRRQTKRLLEGFPEDTFDAYDTMAELQLSSTLSGREGEAYHPSEDLIDFSHSSTTATLPSSLFMPTSANDGDTPVPPSGRSFPASPTSASTSTSYVPSAAMTRAQDLSLKRARLARLKRWREERSPLGTRGQLLPPVTTSETVFRLGSSIDMGAGTRNDMGSLLTQRHPRGGGYASIQRRAPISALGGTSGSLRTTRPLSNAHSARDPSTSIVLSDSRLTAPPIPSESSTPATLEWRASHCEPDPSTPSSPSSNTALSEPRTGTREEHTVPMVPRKSANFEEAVRAFAIAKRPTLRQTTASKNEGSDSSEDEDRAFVDAVSDLAGIIPEEDRHDSMDEDTIPIPTMSQQATLMFEDSDEVDTISISDCGSLSTTEDGNVQIPLASSEHDEFMAVEEEIAEGDSPLPWTSVSPPSSASPKLDKGKGRAIDPHSDAESESEWSVLDDERDECKCLQLYTQTLDNDTVSS